MGALPVAQIPIKTITDVGFYRCSMMIEDPGSYIDQILSFFPIMRLLNSEQLLIDEEYFGPPGTCG